MSSRPWPAGSSHELRTTGPDRADDCPKPRCLGDEVLLPLLDLVESPAAAVVLRWRMSTTREALRLLGAVGINVDGGRCGGSFGLTHGRDLHVEAER